MNIAIFGADGQLGYDLQAALSTHEVTPLLHATVDITDAAAVGAELARIGPQWVINAAAMTNVDLCESESEKAFAVNGAGAGNVATAAAVAGAALIHISSDYVFDGRKRTPYVETDMPKPLNVYGRSKLEGEREVAARAPAHFVVRSSGLYGTHPCRGKGGRNFVETMLDVAAKRGELRVVNDEVLTPTFTEDLAAVLVRLIEQQPPFGVYHATNSGQCSWFEFAREIFRLTKTEVNLLETTAAEWKAPARRPSYSVLDNAALRRAGIDNMPSWQDALRRYLARRKD